jgi:hypothetical protein
MLGAGAPGRRMSANRLRIRRMSRDDGVSRCPMVGNCGVRCGRSCGVEGKVPSASRIKVGPGRAGDDRGLRCGGVAVHGLRGAAVGARWHRTTELGLWRRDRGGRPRNGSVVQVANVAGNVEVNVPYGRPLYRVEDFPSRHPTLPVGRARSQPALLLQARYALALGGALLTGRQSAGWRQLSPPVDGGLRRSTLRQEDYCESPAPVRVRNSELGKPPRLDMRGHGSATPSVAASRVDQLQNND